MDLIRFNDPFAGLSSLHNELDDMFNSFFTTSTAATQTAPAMDVYTEDNKQLTAEIHLPGFSKDEVQVSVHDGILEIQGKKQEKEETKDKKRTYMVRQSSNSFYRRLALPKVADESKVKAKFDNGVLHITVPFKALPKPKQVAITEAKKK